MSGYRLRGHRRNGGVRGTTILGHIFKNSSVSNNVAVESGKNEEKNRSPKLLSHYKSRRTRGQGHTCKR
jgi:hypothetical protein